MSDLLGLALGGVRASRAALEQIGDNVANAATPGYVRRSANLRALVPPGANSPFERDPLKAGGVEVRGVARAADLFRQDSLRRTEGTVALLDAADRWLSLAQSTLTGPASLAEPLSDMFTSLSDLASDPTSLPVRATFLARAETLAERFNGSAAELERLKADLVADARGEARQLGSLAASLANINLQLRRATSGGSAAAGLMDARDRILAEMASIATIDVRFDGRGLADVRLGDSGGPLLVSGTASEPVRVEPGPGGDLRLRVGSGVGEEAPILGGSLNGLSAARVLLKEAGARLDGLADRVAAEFNRVHRDGADLNGLDGGDLFRTAKPVAEAAAGNGGDARLTLTLAAGAAPPPMVLTWNADTAVWTLARADLSGSVSGPGPLTLDGLTVAMTGAAAGGDMFRIAMAGGAAGIGLQPLAPADVAAAARWLVQAAPSNLSAADAEVRIGPPLVPAPAGPFRVVAAGPGVLELRDGADVAIAGGAPGDWLAGDGFEVRVTGTPADGDLFSVLRNDFGGGGNGNAQALAALRDAGGASGTIEEVHDRLVAGMAVPLSEVRLRVEAAREARASAAEALAESAGVSLDREAAEMLQFQQAYQANARVIQTARETFTALLDAAG
jgi:flagellar hook-associated protein 1 FlgK